MNLYDVSIPLFERGLTNMKAFLEKGRAHAGARGLPESALTEARLAEDMRPLTAQVQLACDAAKFVAVRVGGVADVPMADTETSFADLAARIDATLALLARADRADFEGRDERPVTLKTPSRDFDFIARDYVLGFSVPNFFFHVTTAYAILRMKGVTLGKMDFLAGALPTPR
ncbi:DUF1993 domain-containing protein [Stakelama tenebrarum]|uniref:DUF1993 domain-containing protein n=1 Tax=Stakelama tenebrarum TaxID=2711215 RepID=A0A6G6Y333_9SPHN|nr:DUF1993 domain-containing protein [Sphingosinithalassobacter tenebrarum]QIG79217.1 DUF1993 domain-containing protein [Sphingosinithalassobacter tenebrarum]